MGLFTVGGQALNETTKAEVVGALGLGDVAADADRAAAAKEDAENAAAAATAAAGVFTYQIGAFIKRSEGVQIGQYTADIDLPFDFNISDLRAKVTVGEGSCQIGIVINDFLEVGPFTVDDTGLAQAVSLIANEGDDVRVQIQAVTGDVRELFVRISGLPQ